jgi:hypothetical protein
VLPFTTSEFFAVFASYNEAIWPLQLVAAALGVGVVALLLCRPAWSHRAITAIIGALWLLMGLGYHWSFFTVINDAAYGFAGLFVLGALVFLVEGTVRGRIRFAVRLDGWSVIAAVLVAYALILYPVIGLAGAHAYPETPLFGVAPCSTTIFTLAVLMVARHPRPVLVVAVPLLWSLIGGTAAILLDVPQDWGLLAAGALWVAAHLSRRGERRSGTMAT